METIDLTKVAEVVDPDTGRLSYAKYGHLFTKVAFDVFQLNNAPINSYWILEKGEDGAEYLVANYSEEGSEDITIQSDWDALSDKKAGNVTLLYKGVPMKRFASTEYNFTQDDVDVFKSALVSKLSADKAFVGKLLDILPNEKKEAFIKTFPELVSE